jgi:hypothetical protein
MHPAILTYQSKIETLELEVTNITVGCRQTIQTDKKQRTVWQQTVYDVLDTPKATHGSIRPVVKIEQRT